MAGLGAPNGVTCKPRVRLSASTWMLQDPHIVKLQNDKNDFMKRMIATILMTLYLGLLNIGLGQAIRPEIGKLAAGIAKYNVLTSEGVGYAGVRTDQWRRYETLKEKATNEELMELTEHENSVVRCYSFQALANRKNVDLLPILIQHLYDSASVNTFQGCLVSWMSAGDYFLEVVTPQYIDLDAYKLSDKERAVVDSIIIFDKKIMLAAKSDILEKLKPEIRYYDRVREIVEVENNSSGLIALSKFRNEHDKEFFIERLQSNIADIQYYGLWSVRNFPDSSFFPYIVKIHEREIKKPTGFNYPMLRMLYQAIVQYKDKSSRELIELTFDKAKGSTLDYHSEYIWLALEKYPDTIYVGLQDKVKLSEWKRKEMNYWFEGSDR